MLLRSANVSPAFKGLERGQAISAEHQVQDSVRDGDQYIWKFDRIADDYILLWALS